ncbi:MAG: hypothetical protein IJ766_02230 [Clostridia bacterium]|nr:hypothetical protein [Clostridia bacterium]
MKKMLSVILVIAVIFSCAALPVFSLDYPVALNSANLDEFTFDTNSSDPDPYVSGVSINSNNHTITVDWYMTSVVSCETGNGFIF